MERERSIAFDSIPGFVARYRVSHDGLKLLFGNDRFQEFFGPVEDAGANDLFRKNLEANREAIQAKYPAMLKGESVSLQIDAENTIGGKACFTVFGDCVDWGDGEPVYQSRRTQAYAQAFQELERQGLIYSCFCTRAERLAASAPHRSDGVQVYDGRCARLTAEEREELARTRRPAWRAAVPDKTITFCDLLQGEYKEELKKECGDFILRRSDGVYAYQLAVVADDGDMGVTQVVRGRDLLSSTPRQILLYRLLGYPEPEFGHTPLLVSSDGRRLSKRDGDTSLAGILGRGYSPRDVVGALACLAGLLPEPAPAAPEELLPLFAWEKLPREDIPLPPGLFGKG